MQHLSTAFAKFRLLTLVVAMTFGTSAQAKDVWMWVDANGVTNYTQQKPHGVNARRISSADIARSVSDQQNLGPVADEPLSTEQRSTMARLKEEQRAAERQIATQHQEKCLAARDRLTKLIQSPQIRIREENGAVRSLGEDERQMEISQAQQQIARHCTGVS